MTYKEALHREMLRLAGDNRVVFIGQGLLEDDPFYGTLSGIPKNRMLEMPCAEILSTGVAIGLSLTGWIPVLLFQRMDFMLLAADQLLNHAALFPQMSGGQISVQMIIRACVGSQDGKFEVGKQHNKDFSSLFSPYMDLWILHPWIDNTFGKIHFKDALRIPKSLTMTIEYKDMYESEVACD